MKTLDRSRPFGIIYPAHQGAQFEQDGLFFDAQGKQCGEHGGGADPVPEKTDVAPRRGRPSKAKVAESEAKAADLAPEVAAQLADEA